LGIAEGLTLPERKPAPTAGLAKPVSLSEIIRGFKTYSAKRINLMLNQDGPVWQRGYYDHIIRDETELNAIREYIANNPLQWSLDRENHASSDENFLASMKYSSI
jgi:REP element-mobilizing transposase RayT